MIGLPVVTLHGESPLELKDVVFDKTRGEVLGFTLRKHGMLGGPVSEDLSWADVHGLGPDACMIADDSVLTADRGFDPSGGDVIGDRVITENGTDLGEVIEVVIETAGHADVVGFEIEASEALDRGDSHHLFIPLPDTLAISGEKIIVPDSAIDYVRDDLSGFGGAVNEFRSRLEKEDN